jgi:hypothetical protein
MRIVTRALVATGAVAALSFTITPVDAHAATPATAGLATADVALPTTAAGRCHRNYSGKKYCNGERPYHGWSRYHDDQDDRYWDYDEDGDYYYGAYEDYPLVCGPSRYSCRAPRRPMVTPVDVPAMFGR